MQRVFESNDRSVVACCFNWRPTQSSFLSSNGHTGICMLGWHLCRKMLCCGRCGLSLRRAKKCFTFPFFSRQKRKGQSQQAQCSVQDLCQTFFKASKTSRLWNSHCSMPLLYLVVLLVLWLGHGTSSMSGMSSVIEMISPGTQCSLTTSIGHVEMCFWSPWMRN